MGQEESKMNVHTYVCTHRINKENVQATQDTCRRVPSRATPSQDINSSTDFINCTLVRATDTNNTIHINNCIIQWSKHDISHLASSVKDKRQETKQV